MACIARGTKVPEQRFPVGPAAVEDGLARLGSRRDSLHGDGTDPVLRQQLHHSIADSLLERLSAPTGRPWVRHALGRR